MSDPMARRGGMFAAALVGVLAVSPARAADDGYANVFSSLLGSVGLVKGDASPAIEYRERAPLVLPRDASLPKPAAGTVKHSAAWPQDPDVLKNRRALEEAHAPHTLSPQNDDHFRGTSADEMAHSRAVAAEPVRPNECGNDGKQCLLLSPAQMQADAERFKASNPDKADTLVAGKEPDREYLTQPPKGYMKPTKGVKATTVAPEERIDSASPYYARQVQLQKQSQE